MLAIPPVCCFFFWLLSLWSPTCWLWQRDNDEEDGGSNDRIDERTTLPKKVRWLYYLSVVLGFLKISLLSPTCWLWRRDNDEMDGGDDDQRDERTTLPKRVRWLYYLSVVCFFVVVISLVSHMLHGYGGGTTTRRMVATTMGREDNITEESRGERRKEGRGIVKRAPSMWRRWPIACRHSLHPRL